MPDSLHLRCRDIVCVGFADWDTELWTNQHHLMSRLARDNRVLFVESLGLRRPQLAKRDLARMRQRLQRGVMPPRATDGLHVLSPLVIPAHGVRAARVANARLLPALVGRAARRLGMRRPVLWAYAPQAEMLIDTLDPALLIYHCVDDIAAQPGVDAASFRAAEQRYVSRADLVLASSPALAERLRSMRPDVIYAPNVADVELFATALEPGPCDPAMEGLTKPTVVFTGAIVTTKLDVALIVELARMRPRWSFAFVGPVGVGDPSTDVSALAAEPNVHLLGHRPHHELPTVLRDAAAGLIPYAINDLTKSIFPMKVYEYLAAGLPVVSTPLPALADTPAVPTAASAREMLNLLERAIGEDSPEQRLARSRAALEHSWDSRIEEIDAAIAALGRPAVERS